MSKAGAPLHITIHKPESAGSMVVFSFSSSRDLGLQSRNRWYIDYQGLDVTHVAAEMFTMVFLAWQLPVFLQSRAHEITLSADFPVSEDVWLFVERLMRNKGISLNRIQFDGLVDRRPEATDGTPGYGYRQRRTLSVVPDGLPRGLVKEVLSRFVDERDLSFRSLDIVFDASAQSVPSPNATDLASTARFSSDFGVTLRRVALGAAPRGFSAYVLAAVPGLIAGGYTKYATFLGGNRFWRHVTDPASIGNSGQRPENFQALSDFLATAVGYPVQFANVGRSLSGLGAVRALNRLEPGWTSWHAAAVAGSQVWATRTAGVLSLVAASVDRDGRLEDAALGLLKTSKVYANMAAAVRRGAPTGWDTNIGWESGLGIPDFEMMELYELCNSLVQQFGHVESSDATFWSVIAPFGQRGYPDLWKLRPLQAGEYQNGFEDCITAVLGTVLETSEWRGEYPLRSEAVKFTETVELPRPWPMTFRNQQVHLG